MEQMAVNIPQIVILVFFALLISLTRRMRNGPRRTVPVRVVAKRKLGIDHEPYHFVTFEEEDRSRRELQVPDWEYGQITEGDRGLLISNNKRFLGFKLQTPAEVFEEPDDEEA